MKIHDMYILCYGLTVTRKYVGRCNLLFRGLPTQFRTVTGEMLTHFSMQYGNKRYMEISR